jgi:multidrug resistance efflux pump
VSARTGGRLAHLYVRPNQEVKAGQLLAYVENTTDLASVETLERWLARAGQRPSPATIAPPPEPAGNLGELQPAFAALTAAYSTYQQFGPQGLYVQKLALLRADLATLQQLKYNLQARQRLVNQDLLIEQHTQQVQQQLYERKVIPSAELKLADSKLIAKGMSAQDGKAQLLANTSAQLAKQRELLELTHMISEQDAVFQRAVQALTSVLVLWREKYCLIAPASGWVVFSAFWQVNQTVAANQEIFLLVTAPGEQYGEVSLGQQNFGRLRVNNPVLIKFDSYPAQEFGLVTGRVVYISDVPSKNGTFLAKVALPQGLRTNYGKLLTYRDGMTARAEVVADDNRLLDKVLFSFRQALSR